MKIRNIIILMVLFAFSCTDAKVESKRYLASGIKLLYEAEYQKSIEQFDEAIRLNPEDAEIYLQKSRAFYGLRKLDQAMENVNLALSHNQSYGEAYRTKAMLYLEKHDRLKACENFKLAQKYGVHNLANYLNKCR